MNIKVLSQHTGAFVARNLPTSSSLKSQNPWKDSPLFSVSPLLASSSQRRWWWCYSNLLHFFTTYAPSSNFRSNSCHGSNTKSAYPTVRMQTRIHSLIEDEEIALMPGCYDALSAAIVETSGFHAGFISGYAFFVSPLGKPEFFLLTCASFFLFYCISKLKIKIVYFGV